MAKSTVTPPSLYPPLSEFRYKDGVWLNGDCMQTALATQMCVARGTQLTAEFANSVVQGMQDKGVAKTNGATTLLDCYNYARSQGYQPLAWQPYHEPFTGPFHADLLKFAVGEFNSPPILVNVANGQALPGDEGGLHYHGICVVGRDESGYLVADGDRLQPNEAYQSYTIGDLDNAVPVGYLVLALQRQPVEHYYTVKSGDTLAHIAATVGVPLSTIEAKNSWLRNPNLIYPGQQIAY